MPAGRTCMSSCFVGWADYVGKKGQAKPNRRRPQPLFIYQEKIIPEGSRLQTTSEKTNEHPYSMPGRTSQTVEFIVDTDGHTTETRKLDFGTVSKDFLALHNGVANYSKLPVNYVIPHVPCPL